MTRKKPTEIEVPKTATEQLMEKYPEHLVGYVRQNLGLEESDTSKDAYILGMSRADFLDRVATWNGLINYGDTIREWVGGVYGVEIGEDGIAFEDASEGQVRYHGEKP